MPPWKKQRSATRRYQRHQAAVKWAAKQRRPGSPHFGRKTEIPSKKARDFNIKVAFRELTKTYASSLLVLPLVLPLVLLSALLPVGL